MVLIFHASLAVMKALVAKLTAFVPEVDQISGRRLRTILTALESKFSPVFFSAVTGLKQNERKLLRSVMLKEVPDWDSKEKQAFAKGQQSAAADTLQKAPSFRREAESVAQALALAPPYPRSPVKADTQETLVPLIGSLSAVDLDEQAKNLFSESAENVAIEPLEDNRDAFIEETALVSAAGGELPPTGGEPVKNLVTLSVVKAQEDDSLLIDAVTEVQPQKETLETMLLLAPEEQQKDPTLDLIAFDVSVVIPAGAFPTGLAPDQTPSSAEHLTKSPRSAKIITPVASPSHGRGHLISPLLKGTPSTQLSPLKIAPLSANSPRFVLEDAVESMMVAEESPQPEAPNTPPPTAVSMPELVFPELAEEPQIEAPNTPPPTAVSMPELGFPDLAEDRKLLPFEAVAPQSETDIHDKPRRLSDIASPVDLDRSLFAPTEMETISEASIERHPADLRSTDAPTESMVPSTAEMLDGHDSSMWSDFSLSPRQNPIERLQRKIARVRQQAKDEIAILEAEVTESRRRFVSELETLRNERDALIEQHEEAMRTALAASAATEASLNAVVESLRSQIGVLETEMAELRSELARIGEQHDAELSATNEKSENRIKELLDEMESLRAATAEGQSMVEAVEQAKDQELAELRAKLAEAEEGFLALRTTASDVDVIVADLRMSIAERDHQIEALQGQVERAETALMTANSALAEESSVRDTKITALETTVQGFEAKEAAFASVVSDLAAAREEIERLRDTLREREASLQAAILERDLQIESLRTQASEADSLKPLLEAGRVELEALRAELHELETRLKDSTAERDRMLEELGEKSAEIDSLRNELAVLGEEVELAREVALSEANLTNADILREREDLEHALTLQTQRADQLEHELGLKTKEIEQLRTAADTGSDAWESKLEAAASAARESHTAAIASLTAEHERHMQELRHEFENRLASISAETKADNGSPSATSLGMKLIELEVDLATMTGDNERLRLQNAQLESEKEVNRAYLERLEERIQSEHQEQQDLAERELVSTRQQVEELRHLLRESELAYENLSRAYNAEIHGVREADDEDEFLDAIESNQLASLDDAIPLLTTDDVSLATFQFLLENSQPDDINGNTLGTLCELAKSNDQNALTLAKTLLLARDSITMDPFIVENNEEPAVDLIVIGAEAINVGHFHVCGISNPF